jgi:hypothetical protein
MSTPTVPSLPVAILTAAALAAGVAGCGLSSSTHHPHVATAPTHIRPVAPARAASKSSPAATVLRRYAVLYGNLCSCSQAAATLNELATLATPALAAQLRTAAISARAAVARGLPEPARAVGTIASLELSSPDGRTRTGLVVLAERSVIAHRGTTAPTPVAYAARLVLTPAGWRVAAFRPLPPRPHPGPSDAADHPRA